AYWLAADCGNPAPYAPITVVPNGFRVLMYLEPTGLHITAVLRDTVSPFGFVVMFDRLIVYDDWDGGDAVIDAGDPTCSLGSYGQVGWFSGATGGTVTLEVGDGLP
ncbi:MAG TPA: hypothetical protein VMW52_10905, partial [Phycisphaerae bacterium]|nr:hypothetical protein [Phycisphaerae bacterium]